MKLLSAAILTGAVVINTAIARPAPASHVQHEWRNSLYSDEFWVKGEPIDGGFSVPVRVGLTQSNLDRGAEMLLEIAQPTSPSYGKHLSMQDITELFAPPQDRIELVRNWLRSYFGPHHNISLSPSQQYLQLNATISELQHLLHTQYHEYQHRSTGKSVLGCDGYHVPHHLHEHIDFITPGVKGLILRKRGTPWKRNNKVGGGPIVPKITRISGFRPQTPDIGAQCGFAITPACVKLLYNITDKIKGNPDNSIGIFETEDVFVNRTDLNTFFATFTPRIPQGTQPVYNAIDGAPPLSSANYTISEGDIDFMAVYPLVYPDKVVNFQVDDTFYESYPGSTEISGLFNTFLDALDRSYCTYSAYGETGDAEGIDPTYPDRNPGGFDHPEQCGTFAATKVISISYSLDEDNIPMNYQLRQCNEWMKLGLQGVSVIAASGDSGVAPRDELCARNNTLFATESPIDCPYVTAVGATRLPLGGIAGKTPEQASSSFGSGGGFSNIFRTPAYQARAVHSYFNTHPVPYPYYNITLNATHSTGVYNRGGRGYPDVAATGENFAIFADGYASFASGTSVSAPVFAGIIARINSARLDAGKQSLGFLNPTLYQHPDIFNDITVGNNPGCETAGFEATPGWDPVTGLGTPNYGRMKELFLSLP